MAFYTPRRLIEVKNEIKKKHPLKKTLKAASAENIDLKVLIMFLESLETDMVEEQAYTLTDEEMGMVFGYVPHNYYQSDLTNIFRIIKLRLSERYLDVFYHEWQRVYDSEECDRFILKDLLTEKEFISYAKKKHISRQNMEQLLQAESIPAYIDELCADIPCPAGISLEAKIAYFGIEEDTRLFHDCKMLFYTICHKNDYMTAGQDVLLKILNRYGTRQRKAFLRNFLQQLRLRELSDFQKVAYFFIQLLGWNITNKKAAEFLDAFSDELKTKYRNWLNQLRIDLAFENDERAIFWRNYAFETIEQMRISDSLIMHSKTHVVIEFLGRGMGPIYIYTKEIYEKKIHSLVLGCNNAQLRSELYDLYYTKAFPCYRKAHLGEWKSSMTYYLRQHNITQRITE